MLEQGSALATLEIDSCVQSKYRPLGQSQAMSLCFLPQKRLNPEGGGYLQII